jgi:hypothetical protein
MAYSLHEKSGLVSVPIDPDDVLRFKKEDAKTDVVAFDRTFLDPESVVLGEGASLAQAAWEAAQAVERKRSMILRPMEDDIPEEAIPEELFPPCMRNILGGLVDGKKRAMFALTNFMVLAGWSVEMIDARLHEWNLKNPEPLREVLITGHVRSLKTKRERFPPPSCREFYQQLGVCKPDDLCNTIKNPSQYAKKRASFGAPKKKAKKKAAVAVAPEPAGGAPVDTAATDPAPDVHNA